MKSDITAKNQHLENSLKKALLTLKAIYMSYYDTETLNPIDKEEIEDLLMDPYCKELIKNERFLVPKDKKEKILKHFEELEKEYYEGR